MSQHWLASCVVSDVIELPFCFLFIGVAMVNKEAQSDIIGTLTDEDLYSERVEYSDIISFMQVMVLFYALNIHL